MKTSYKAATLSSVLVIATTSAFGSFFVNGANGGDGDAYTNYVPANNFNQSVRIDMGNSYGSAGLFDRSNFTRDGDEYIKLCFATADHVVRGGALQDITFAGASTQHSLAPGTWTHQIVLGGYDGDDDLAFVGMQAKRSDLAAPLLTFLDSLNGLTLGIPVDTSDATNYGFGTSGNYTRDGNNDIDGFFWRPVFENFNDSRGYFNHRSVKSDVTSVSAFSYSIYNFDAIKWQVSNATGFGGINQGDSGGVIFQDGKFVGVNSFNNYIEGNDLSGPFRIYQLGSNQGGNAFTQDNMDWLEDHCALFESVPEPTSMVALAGIALAAVARKRRK